MSVQQKTSVRESIILVDDDPDDAFLIEDALSRVAPTYLVLTFYNADDALQHLTASEDPPLLILCTVRLPGMNGLELRQAIATDPALKKRGIPFLLLSDPVLDSVVDQAYELMVQGFFVKPYKNNELQTILKVIIDYWSNCIPPRL